ncbi:arsenical resistance operon repressor [Escherichia coli]|uniref:Arsenical resistance operon repressor n=1 Tax=Escherichia coli TaxID=562 RepID=A0A376RCW5_ECOLX|nr:arsenical resistance operon repressor [Escherichia coli]
MSFLLPIQLFKILADETRLGIVLLLSELGELCVCDLCTALDQSQPKISRHLALLREAGYCWTASKVSGFITAYHRIFQHGRRKLLMRPGDVNRKRFRRLSATWLDKTVPGTVRTFAVKNLAKHI